MFVKWIETREKHVQGFKVASTMVLRYSILGWPYIQDFIIALGVRFYGRFRCNILRWP